MSLKVIVFSLAVGGLVLFVAAVTDLSLGRAAVLAPVLVIGIGALVGLTVLWGRIALQSLREARRPGLVIATAVGFIGLLVGLTLLGVRLPRE